MEPARNMQETHRNVQENAGYHRTLEAVFRDGFLRIFPVISDDFRREPTGTWRNLQEKSGDFPVRNTASVKSRECAGTGRFPGRLLRPGLFSFIDRLSHRVLKSYPSDLSEKNVTKSTASYFFLIIHYIYIVLLFSFIFVLSFIP